MFLKEKLVEQRDFSAFKFKIYDKEIIVKLKKVNYRETDFAYNMLADFKGDMDELTTLIKLFVEDVSDEDLNLIFSDHESGKKFIHSVFTERNFNMNFVNLTIESLDNAFKTSQSIFSKFVSALLLFGYKLIELDDLSQTQILDLAIKEMLYRDPNVLIEFLESECVDPDTKQLLEHRKELYDYILEKKKDLGLVKVTKDSSSFDQLNSL